MKLGNFLLAFLLILVQDPIVPQGNTSRGHAGGGITVTNITSGGTCSTGAGGSCAIAATGTTSGNFAVIFLENVTYGAGGTITDTQSNTWAANIGSAGGTLACGFSNQPCYVFGAKLTGSGADTITITSLNAFATGQYAYFEISGLATGAVDQNTGMGSAASNWTSPTTGTTTAANEAVVCYGLNANAFPTITTGGYTGIAGSHYHVEAYQIVSSTGTFSCGGTSSSGSSNGAIITYK